ncbi:MAG TPA: hypothetical protein VFS21_16030, partial [Roseiflexaceae bacterium]|nr:hypothetical protein [Roseiflexaceae bacterium]
TMKKVDYARECLDLAVSSSRSINETTAHIIALLMIIRGMAKSGLANEIHLCALNAKRVIELIDDGSQRSWASYTIGMALSETPYIDIALELTESMSSDDMYIELMLKIIKSMKEKGRLTKIKHHLVWILEALYSEKYFLDIMLEPVIDTFVGVHQIDVVVDSLELTDEYVRIRVMNTLIASMKKRHLDNKTDSIGSISKSDASKQDSAKEPPIQAGKTRIPPENSNEEEIEASIETLNQIENLNDDETRRSRLEGIAGKISRIPDTTIVLDLLLTYWSNLSRRDDLITMLPAATPLIAAHPPLLQELLDGFDWVDQILKKW